MHHFLYPTQDTFITNRSGLDNLNFGLNEVLRVGTENLVVKTISQNTAIPFSQSVSNFCLSNFSGSILTASLYGTSSTVVGIISSSGIINISSSYYTGTLTGSFHSASFLTSSNFTGSLTGFTGSLSGKVKGTLSGSFLTDFIDYFNANVIEFTGKVINGIIVGTEFINQQNTKITNKLFADRALFQFNLDAISQSVANGDIENPNFTLKMKVARAEELPIQYSLVAFPVVESWVMGNGYFFDGGSSQGANWIYRDKQSGTKWTATGSTYVTTPTASQFFNYEAGDVSMDVTNIAMSWISGSIPNNGLVILSNDEFATTSSGMTLYFFSKDTNTIYSPYLDAGWSDFSMVTGSVGTASISTITVPPGLTASFDVTSPSLITGIDITGSVFGVMNVVVDSNNSASGFVSLTGTSGTINGSAIFGSVSGSINVIVTTSSFTFPGFGPLFDLPPEDIDTFSSFFGFFPFINTTNTLTTTMSISVLDAQFLDGIFSGSYISASITNHVQLTGGITGSWNTFSLADTQISASYPFLNYPSMVITFNGPHIHGSAFGQISNVNYNPGSGIFNGTIIDGDFAGARLMFPFSGSISTSSFSYTSSINITSSSLQPLNISAPFTVVLRVPEKVKTNEIIKIKIFGREQFPIKNFQRTPQFSQFTTPLYLPLSSYYAIKDNETEETILDFDRYTQISCDPSGSYFLLDTSGLPQERYFKVLIKLSDATTTYIIDNNDIFKVVR